MVPIIYTTDVDMISEYPDIYQLAIDDDTSDNMVSFITEMLKQVEEEENMIVINPFVRDMCNYYKIKEDEVMCWQEYYEYMKDVKGVGPNLQNAFNEEMKKYFDEKKVEEEPLPRATDNPLWNAIKKGGNI